MISYTYDTDGVRVSKTVNGATTEYLIDKNRDYAQVLEKRLNDELVADYVYGLDLISQERGGEDSFYLVDGLGSTRHLTDESGKIIESYVYDAFGNLIDGGDVKNDYLFAGEQYDEDLGQSYLRERYYDPLTGRFTRRDTYEGSIYDPVSLHKYLYAHTDPVNNIDPSGLFTLTEALAGSAMIGSLAGALAGGYYGAHKSGEAFSKETLKFALVGAVGGAAAGAMIGGVIYLTPASLGSILTRGLQELFKKASGPHSKTAGALIGGFALGFTGGLIEPDYDVTLGTAFSTVITIVDDALIRGAIWRRNEIARIFGREFVAQAKILFKYGQSTTLISIGFLFGFTVGYASGARIRKAYDSQYGSTT